MWPERVQEDEQLQQFGNKNTPANLVFDIPGAVTLAIATSSLLAAVDLQASRSWRHPVVFGLIIVGILSTVAFLAFETFPGNRELLMPLKLLKAEIGAFCAGQVLGILSLWTRPPTLSLVLEPAPHQFLASSLHGHMLTSACGLVAHSCQWLRSMWRLFPCSQFADNNLCSSYLKSHRTFQIRKDYQMHKAGNEPSLSLSVMLSALYSLGR